MLSMSVGSAFDATTSMDWSLKQAYYNSKPLLVRHLHRADISGLRQLFAEGQQTA